MEQIRTRISQEALRQSSLHVVYGRQALLKAEHGLDNADLRVGALSSHEAYEVVDNAAACDSGRASVDGTRAHLHAEQGCEFFLFFTRAAWLDQAALVRESAVRPDEREACDRVSERFHAQDVLDDLFRLSIKVRVDESHVVVARNDVAKG